MSIVLRKLWSFIHYLGHPIRRKNRVRFTPSTLERELEKAAKTTEPRNSFLNFLSEIQSESLRQNPDLQITPTWCVRVTKAAGRKWRSMSDKEKRPYCNIAKKQPVVKRLKRNHKSLTQKNINRNKRSTRKASLRNTSSHNGSEQKVSPRKTLINKASNTVNTFIAPRKKLTVNKKSSINTRRKLNICGNKVYNLRKNNTLYS